jgi:hypothetical protein
MKILPLLTIFSIALLQQTPTVLAAKLKGSSRPARKSIESSRKEIRRWLKEGEPHPNPPEHRECKFCKWPDWKLLDVVFV